MTSANEAEGGSVAVTVDVICSTLAKRVTSKSFGTLTDPGVATRPRSLRSRSTIIRFSARFFSSAASAALRSASTAASPHAGAVPFIGRASTRPRE